VARRVAGGRPGSARARDHPPVRRSTAALDRCQRTPGVDESGRLPGSPIAAILAGLRRLADRAVGDPAGSPQLQRIRLPKGGEGELALGGYCAEALAVALERGADLNPQIRLVSPGVDVRPP
jgi:hypothetical protein